MFKPDTDVPNEASDTFMLSDTRSRRDGAGKYGRGSMVKVQQ